MTLENICREVFSFFYEKVYKTPCPPALLDSERSQSSYVSFCKILNNKYGESANVDYVWMYVLFQYGRYYTAIKENTLKDPTGKITPLIVFGKSAYKVYEERRVEMDFMAEKGPLVTVEQITKREFSVRKGIEFSADKKIEKHVSIYRDPVKVIASKGEGALDTCIDETDLYDDQDPSCQRCPDQKECKETLKDIYPKIYKKRGYE